MIKKVFLLPWEENGFHLAAGPLLRHLKDEKITKQSRFENCTAIIEAIATAE